MMENITVARFFPAHLSAVTRFRTCGMSFSSSMSSGSKGMGVYVVGFVFIFMYCTIPCACLVGSLLLGARV